MDAPEVPSTQPASRSAPEADAPATGAPPVPSAPGAAVPAASAPARRRLPPGLWIAIGALVAITLLVIVSLFLGDVPARGTKVIVTIILFGMFVGVTIGELAIADRDRGYPVAFGVVTSVYVLAWCTLLTWLEPVAAGDRLARGGDNAGIALLMLVPLLVVAKLPVVAVWLFLRPAGTDRTLRALTWVSAGLLGALAVVLFLPLLLGRSFRVEVGDWFGRLIVIVAMLAFLAASIDVLLTWWTGRDRRRAARAERARARVAGPVRAAGAPGPVASVIPAPPATSASPATGDGGVPAGAASAPLPWPVAEDGVTPLPAGPDGRPVFSVLRPWAGRTAPVAEGDPEADAAVERARRRLG